MASIIDIMSILLPCSAAIAVPQLTSTGSNLTPRSAAICLPSETPTPLAQSPDFGSFENHGGACVTPTRSAPRCLIWARVLSAACDQAAGAMAAAASASTERRWNRVDMASALLQGSPMIETAACALLRLAVRDLDDLFAALAQSAFRRRFALGPKERAYLAAKGRAEVLAHAREFVARRLAPAAPRNDGKQTPLRGHPVFVAQHATATCCRGCLAKWHRIDAGRALTAEEQGHVVAAIARWLDGQAAADMRA